MESYFSLPMNGWHDTRRRPMRVVIRAPKQEISLEDVAEIDEVVGMEGGVIGANISVFTSIS